MLTFGLLMQTVTRGNKYLVSVFGLLVKWNGIYLLIAPKFYKIQKTISFLQYHWWLLKTRTTCSRSFITGNRKAKSGLWCMIISDCSDFRTTVLSLLIERTVNIKINCTPHSKSSRNFTTWHLNNCVTLGSRTPHVRVLPRRVVRVTLQPRDTISR